MNKSLLTLLAAFALTIGSAAAQSTPPAPGKGHGRTQGSPEEMAKRQSERMSKELGLSPDQTTKVQQILAARDQEMQANRGKGKDGNRDQMREQMQANRAKYDAQFKEVLSAEQYAKYTSMEAKHGGGGPGRGKDDKVKVKTKGDKKVKVNAEN
jgi:Spy/CpxP family protein refolding chaperone